MASSLNSQSVTETMKAKPVITQTNSGVNIPYPFPSPADWRDHWIYFLLVDRFNNPSRAPVPDIYPCLPYQGGNFSGIRQQLPYLKSLGVGAIWISPVLFNPQWFNDYWGGYGTLDFIRIEPRFCDNPAAALADPSKGDKEFRDLVDEIHAQGMYVILDIVLNHAGNIFNYEGARDTAPWRENGEYNIFWRDENGQARGDWKDIGNIPNPPTNGVVWPKDLQRNDYFRRKGEDGSRGDFTGMKELVTEYLIPGTSVYPVRNILITAYQYLIAKFDLDGYRIDTLQYVEAAFARVFGNAMREYALSIGKKNFFTFGEVWQDDDESKIAEFVGRNTENKDHFVGVDAAIDFPMKKRLEAVCKGFAPPQSLSDHFDYRLETLRKIVSSHGDAGRHYVTFLDNHDQDYRFHDPSFPEQTKMAMTCMMCMQGIPSVYYGTEQALSGRGGNREFAREALWGRQNAFNMQADLYKFLQELSAFRASEPALRYGRQYFRPCSENGGGFKHSSSIGGVIAFSRVLNNKEVVVAVNTSTSHPVVVDILVDKNLHEHGRAWETVFPFSAIGALPDLSSSHDDLRTIRVSLAKMEFVIIAER
jgi:glycosidase